MTSHLKTLICSMTVAFLLVISHPAIGAETDTVKNARYFMFIGTPSTAAWKFLIENPADRKAATEKAMEEIGGKMLSYWFGLGDGKNYIICQLPNDNELIQAVYVMRLPSGLLNSYEMIELMPSEEMTNALKRSVELMELEKKMGAQ